MTGELATMQGWCVIGSSSSSRFAGLVGIVALPRSGTTVVTGVLSVHSAVKALYEPWNANKGTSGPNPGISYVEFIKRFAPEKTAASVLVLKETTTELSFAEEMERVIEDAPPTVKRTYVIILRNPFHVFLSEVQARRDWWGAENASADAETFDIWASRTIECCHYLAGLALRRGAILLSYDRFVANPSLISELTEACGLPFEERQLAYESHLDRAAVRGDQGVAAMPEAVSARSVGYRDAELMRHLGRLSGSRFFTAFQNLARAMAQLPPISYANEQRVMLSFMQQL